MTRLVDRALKTLSCVDVSCRMGREVILNDISFSLLKGEVIAILGKSGVGKSTLLRALAGLIPPVSGSITAPQGARVALLFQDALLQPWLTVTAHINLPGRLGGYSVDANQLISQVGLSGYEDAYPRQLSGGMKRRVALARALAQQPTILLLDEPYSNLDESTSEMLYDELLQLVEIQQISAVLVTHNIIEALKIADRVFVLAGRPARIVFEEALPSRTSSTARDLSSPGFATAWTNLRRKLTAEL